MVVRSAAWQSKDRDQRKVQIAEELKMEKVEESRSRVEEWLTSWFVARAKIGRGAAERAASAIRSTDYFDAGWLTSMEVVEFVTEIERQFAMQFSDRDLQDARFVTITGLAELICAHSVRMNEGC
jgi:acyl carrier protein